MLRVKISSLLVSVLLVLSASAQNQTIAAKEVSAATDADPATTYFLIDASGSMEDKDAEFKVQQLLKPISAADPEALVSRTYFRSKTRETCGAVEIEDPVPAKDSQALTIKYENDFTPLGEALKSAILRAVSTGEPANIYLISDVAQTPGCGVDICDVASALLPVEGINVVSWPVETADKQGRDRLGCIEVAQGRALLKSTPPTVYETPPTTLFETWAWFVAFAMIAASAGACGLIDSRKAVVLANNIRTARFVRDGVLANNENSKADLVKLQNKRKEESERKKNSWLNPWWPFARWVFHWKFMLLNFGLALLAFIVLGHDFGFRADQAQRAAWHVLNTEFATAFAVLWLATIFFMMSQSQRRREAEQDYLILIDEAGRIQAAAEAGQRQALWNAYEFESTQLNDLKFEEPSQVGFLEEEAGRSKDFDLSKERFGSIVSSAKDMALGEPLIPTSDLEELRAKITVLKAARRFKSTGMWSKRLNFGDFVQNLLNLSLIRNDTKKWEAVVLAYENAEPAEIQNALSELSSK
jgi:hypothetical protein